MFFKKYPKRNNKNTNIIVNYTYLHEPKPLERSPVFPRMVSIIDDIYAIMKHYNVTYDQYDVLIDSLNERIHTERHFKERGTNFSNDKLRYDLSDEVV